MARPRKYSAEFIAAAVDACGREKIGAVAARFEVPVTALNYWRTKAGQQKPRGRPRRIDYSAAFSRWNEGGESVAAIAHAFGVCDSAIRYALKHAPARQGRRKAA